MKPEDAKQLFNYDPNTGILTWKRRIGDSPSIKVFNSNFPGKPAGSIRTITCGYKNVGIWHLGKRHLAHRIAWMIMTGEMPPGSIDHINGDATDNRWMNLRNGEVENRKNISKYINNKSGVNGVHWHKKKNKWEARCGRKYLGRFDDLEDAKRARREFETASGYTSRHGRDIAMYHK